MPATPDFAPPYNVLSSESELMIQVNCAGVEGAAAKIGTGNQLQYIYQYGYAWHNNQWEMVSYTGSDFVDSGSHRWYIGTSDGLLPYNNLELEAQQYIVAYVCTWTGSSWKCGCRDSACITNHWNLQIVQNKSISFVWPVDNPNLPMSNPYAAYNVIGNYEYHTGFDLTSASDNTTVYAAAGGVVRTVPKETYRNDNHYMGDVIIIDHNNGQGPFTLYSHLERIDVTDGAIVNPGDPIGVMGDTGCSILEPPCGIHLHFEVKQWGVLGNLHDDWGPEWGYTPDQPNLYGYQNPWPYFDHALTSFAPSAVRSLANQIVRTGPGGPDSGYEVDLGSVVLGQLFVSSQRVDDWYQIDFPSEYGPAKGWIQAVPESSINIRQVVDPYVDDPDLFDKGVAVCPTAAACFSSPERLSYVWDQQYIVGIEQVPAENGCASPWVRTSLLGAGSGWVCGDYLSP